MQRPSTAEQRLALRILVVVSCALAACRTTRSERSSAHDQPIVYHAAPQRAWQVSCAGTTAGSVIFFSSEAAPEQSVYVVRNDWGQDLGWVDSLGRAYRLLPHHKDPAWVGTGTVLQGVERILRAAGPCELVEHPLEAAAAAPAEAGSGS